MMIHNVEALIYGCVNNNIIITMISNSLWTMCSLLQYRKGALTSARQWEAFNGWRSWDMERVHKINQGGNSDFEKALKDLIKLNLEQKTEADRVNSQVNQGQRRPLSGHCFYCSAPGHYSCE